MEEQANDVSAVRVSGRPNKGKPPLRFGCEEIGAVKVPPPKSTSSKASSAKRKSQAEAERDVKIANLKKQHATKLKDSKILQIKIETTQAKLIKVTDRCGQTPNSYWEYSCDKLQEELDQLKMDKAMVDVELQSMEMTLKEELQAIKSACQAELDQIEEDDILSGDENVEDAQARTVTWAEEQAKIVHVEQQEKLQTEKDNSLGLEHNSNNKEEDNDEGEDNFEAPIVINKKSAEVDATPKSHYSRALTQQPAYKYPWYEDSHQVPVVPIKSTFSRVTADATKSCFGISHRHEEKTEAELGSHEAYQRHRKKRHSTDYYDSSSDEDNRAPGSQRQSSTKEVTMHDLVTALNNFGSNSQRSEIVMKTAIDKDLPKFGGEPEQWVQFKSEFDRTTRKLKIDDSENMIRLRKSLVGQAKATVQHLMVNVNNVSVIMEALEKRFGRPRVVLNALAAKAKACGNVTIAKPESIIEFGLAIQALVANVKSFKADGYLHSTELLETLVKKLSPDLATRWYEWLSADSMRGDNLIGFSDWTSIQLDIAYQRADTKFEDTREERGDHRRRRGPGAVNIVTTEEGKCLYCQKGNHILEKCWAFQKKSLDDRWNFVKTSRACICCLRQGHRAKECNTGSKCDVSGCNRYHHRLLHNDRKSGHENENQNRRRNQPPMLDDDENSQVKIVGNFAVISGCDGPLPIVPVKLSGPSGTIKCHALLDTGASRSLIKMSIAEKIGLEGVPTEYSYKGITGEKKTEKNAMLVSCDVAGIMRGSNVNKLRSAITVEDIKMNPFTMNVEEIKRKWPHLRNVAASNLLKVVPDVVIGNNNPHLILARKLVLGADDEPVGWRSELGWAISGNFDNDGTGVINSMSGGISNEELHTLIKQSFSLDDFGVKPSAAKGKNLDEKRAYAILESTTRKVGDRWEVGLLWREDNVQFPESEFAAMKRLQYMERKMTNPNFRQLYHAKMEEYLAKGYMKKLTSEEAAVRKPSTYTIPHFGVTNPNKPGKLRLVLDAKAKCHGVSLNDKLLKGPDLIRSLVGILWNFRKHRIALTGDISDMFHRVMIRDEDRDSQRLLWREHPNGPVETYQMQVMIFGATSSPSSSIHVKNENARQYMEKYPTAAIATIDHFYVDDCLSGGDSEEEVIELRKQLSEINAAGNFNLCKFMSNSFAVLESIPEDLRAEGSKNFQDKDDLPGERVLGMWWNSHDDIFQFKLGLHKVKSKILGGDIPTKREMTGLIMSLFDPLGLICHYKIKAIILQQEVWGSGIGWDDEIPFATFLKWRKWLSRLEEVKDVKLPRCYSPYLNCAEDIQLHIFVDASSEAYCCICYLRITYKNEVVVVFVGARARVAPLKKSTIPRLELQAALMGTRLASVLQEETKLKVNRRFFWSDSSTVLQWLASRSGNLKEFVANRIGEIQECTNLEEWNWIPTKLNIADVATRFDSEISFKEDSEWYQGPQFLRDDPDTWNFAEERKRKQEDGVVAALVASEQYSLDSQDKCNQMNVIPQPERFSSFIRLVRSTAAVREAAYHWICRWRNKESRPPWSLLSMQCKNKTFVINVSSNLSASGIVEAENQIVKLAQLQSFNEDINTLRDGGQLKRKGKLWKLCPFVDHNGVLRAEGRISAAVGVPEETKNPIILPSRNHITELIVDAEHVRCAHQGIETVLNNLRRRFWIVDARHTVKRSWTRCGICRLARVKPLNPKMGNLPDFRLASNQPAFTFTGIDLFGPMQVTVGRRHEKRWGVLICCMVTRAVHLEIVHSLETDEIMMALSRFIDVRGRPCRIHSDNGTNFVGAARELKEQWGKVDFAKIQQHGKFHMIEWTFNPPAAPHMGGAWERLIQIVKKSLQTTLREIYPKDTTLLTVFKSVENIVNSRPLTHISNDPHDPVPITPNDILRGGCDTGPSLPAVMDSSDMCLREKWKRSQILADQFWRRWTNDYLPKLIRREKWQEPTEPMQIGDLVFLVDENLPRNCWIRGVVSQIFPGKDGQVRQVEVTTKWNANSKKETKFRRPVAKLCPLGLRMEIKGPEDP